MLSKLLKRIPPRVRYALFAILTAAGVGYSQAARMVGCESGAIDDAVTIPVDPAHPEGERVDNPNLGECIEFK